MYTIKSNDTRINTAFERISKGISFDEKLVPYSIIFLNEIIKYFEDKEDFEKCQTVMDALNDKTHEKAYTKWTQNI
jgi:hypothetical protein